MSDQHHQHSNQHGHHPNHHEHGRPPQPKRNGQNRWFIVAVVLMLVGMLIYVLSDDEADKPGADKPVPQAPAE